MSIKEKAAKINEVIDFFLRLKNWIIEHKHFREILYSLIIILVAGVSFGLGILAEREKGSGPTIRILEQSATANLSGKKAENTVVIPDKDPGGYVVGSVNSDKYHFPWCSGARRINEANKIWFNSIEEAREEGYTPAGNCEGLE